ncbi:DUF4476 domain-containing protein [Chitinophaga sp. 30R24]|uniref:DUF4476 domain-containing protein n=1 Tax=Chitinophaga sp. 30R24 TaxID=3248838 RepID=UPI003B8EE5E2
MYLRFRSVLFVWGCLLLCGRVWAQEQHHFIYIQSEKGLPFYVKYHGKVLSSTERGYIILSQLENGTTSVTIGFPKNESHEAQFNLKVAKSDEGFLLKQSGDAGYSLYNLQTFHEIRAEGRAATVLAAAPAHVPDIPVPTQDNAPAEMVANQQKDLGNTVTDKAVAKEGAKGAKSGNPFASALDKIVVSSDDRNEPEPEVVTDGKSGKYKKQKNERMPLTEEEQAILSEVMADEGKMAASEAAAEDVAKAAGTSTTKRSRRHKVREGNPDFIEFQDDQGQVAPAPQVTVAPSPVAADVTAPIEEEQPVHTKKKKHRVSDDTEHPANIVTDASDYGIAAPAVAAEEPPVKTKKKKKHGSDEEAVVDPAGMPEPTVAGVAVDDAVKAPAAKKKSTAVRLINTDCVNIMDDETFHKLLRKFVAARTDNSMLEVFRKQTRNYCLETAQIKTLAQLLTADDTRYRLLDAAYSKTYDTEKYSVLEGLLIDDYYKGRFKAMLHR